MTLLILTSFTFLIYFSMILRSEAVATLLVVITIPLLSAYIKSAIMLDLISSSNLLILAICLVDFSIILSAFCELISIMTYFLERSLVVMLILGLSFFKLLRTL